MARTQRLPTNAILLFCLTLVAFWVLSPSSASAQEGPGGGDGMPRYWEIHASLLTAGTTIFVLAYLALWLKMLGKLDAVGNDSSVLKKIGRFWYRWHTYLATAGTALAITGVLWGIGMVQLAYGGPHLRLSHSYLGVTTGAIASMPVMTGLATRLMRHHKKALRR